MIRHLGVVLCITGFVGLSGQWPIAPVYAAEYQGKPIDGQKFPAKAYSYETGGVFDIQVEFQKKRATMYFVNGGKKTIRLKRSEIADPQNIVGWGVGVFNIGGVFGIGISKENGNLEPPHPRPFEGLWRIILQESALR